VEVVTSLSQGRTAAAQCGSFTYKSVPVIFEPPCILHRMTPTYHKLQGLCSPYKMKTDVSYEDFLVTTTSDLQN